MRKTLKLVKLLVAVLMRYSGLLSLTLQRRLRNQSIVLTYHRVLDDKRAPLTNSHAGIVVSDKVFEMHMQTLRRHFNPVTLDELRENIKHGTTLPARSCLVTFDDGWLDNYEIAFPILKKYKIPAVIFLPVNYISADSMFWQEEIMMRLSSLLSSGNLEKLDEILSILETPSVRTIEEIRKFVIELKSTTEAKIKHALDTVRDELISFAEPRHYNRYLTWEQVVEMQAAGITFASHALSHKVLCRLSDAQCRTELVTSRTILEERLGQPVRAIAYPNGDHDARVMRETAKAGYTMAFSTRGGFVESSCNPLSIPRNNIHNDNSRNEAQFMCACARLF